MGKPALDPFRECFERRYYTPQYEQREDIFATCDMSTETCATAVQADTKYAWDGDQEHNGEPAGCLCNTFAQAIGEDGATCYFNVPDGEVTFVNDAADYFRLCPAATSVAPPPAPCTKVHIALHTDQYPGDYSWVLEDECTDKVVKRSDTFMDQRTTYEEEACVPAGHKYSFVIEDSFGDGVCCAYGKGNIQVTIGNTVYSNEDWDNYQDYLREDGEQQFTCKKLSWGSCPDAGVDAGPVTTQWEDCGAVASPA